MGDEHHRRPGLPLQPVHQGEDLGLDRHIQRRRGLIRDQQLRLTGQRHGNHHPLPHAARQLVRILRQPPFRLRYSDLPQQLQRPRPRRLSVHVLVQPQPLGQLPPDGEDRVQRRHRLLEDHSDLVAPDRPHQVLRRLGKVDLGARALVEDQPTPGNLATPELHQPHQRQRRHRLARPGFADNTNRLPGEHLERHVLDTGDRSITRLEFHPQVLDAGDGVADRAVEHGVSCSEALE